MDERAKKMYLVATPAAVVMGIRYQYKCTTIQQLAVSLVNKAAGCNLIVKGHHQLSLA